jgi:dTDP-4-dehydrorhamnose 3,5-epimerase
MVASELEIAGCWSFEPKIHSDSRGNFYEWFQEENFSQVTGENFQLAQANCSVSKKGVLRGIHFTKLAPGQAKLVTVFSGAVLDVLVDLRKSSPTFKKWLLIPIEADQPKTIYVPWGVGHGFLSLTDNTVFAYLCDARYNPSNEFDLNAFDSDIGIHWPSNLEIIRSSKDENAKTLKESFDVLPD